MDSPPSPISPSPSTPTSGDEEYDQRTPASGASPVPKRRAVAPSGSGVPQHSRSNLRRSGPGGGDVLTVHGGKIQLGSGPSGAGTGAVQGGGQRDELLDVAYMNELKARE